MHLDIKPQNLLLREKNEKKNLALIDFGLAAFRPPDRPGGTANYIPPELIVRRLGIQSHDFPKPDRRSDLYSLGVTFYYCLTGVQPFRAKTQDGLGTDPEATLKNHLIIDPPPPSALRNDIPHYLDRIIMKLMARHPDDRYPSAIIAAQALQYSSPRDYPAESVESLLSYLPREGRMIGRGAERMYIQSAIEALASDKKIKKPVIIIEGAHGSGKSRLLRACKPFAQRLEIAVELAEDTSGFIDNEDSATKREKMLLLVDDAEKYLQTPKSGELENISKSILLYLKNLRLSRKLDATKTKQNLIIFTVNPERLTGELLMEKFRLEKDMCHILSLGNFNVAEVGEYLAALLGEKPDKSVVEQLHRYSGGNPLVLTEHLEGMIFEGRLFSLAGRPDAKTIKTLGIDFAQTISSRTLSDTIEAKLSRLSDDAKKLAFILACWHRPASSDELSATSCIAKAQQALLELTKIDILERSPKDGKLSFSNPHLASIILHGKSTKDTEAVHDKIFAQLKSSRKTGRDELLLHIAYGRDSNEKHSALRTLANSCKSHGKYIEAIKHLTALLKTTGVEHRELKASVHEEIGALFEKLQRYDEALSTYSSIKKIKCKSADAVYFKLKMLELIGRLEMRRRDLKRAAKIFSKGIKLTGNKKNLALWRIRFENYLGGIDLRSGNFKSAVERFKKTEKVTKKILKTSERRKIDNNELGEALLRSGKHKEALKILLREYAAAKASETTDRIAGSLYLIGNALRSEAIRDYDGARVRYLEGLNIAKKHKLLRMQLRIGNGIGNLCFMISKPKEAFRYYQEAFKLSQQIDSTTTSVELMIGMGLASQKLGDIDKTIEYFEAALDFSGGPKGDAAGIIRQFRSTIYVSLADAYYQKKNFEKAREYIDLAKALDKKEKLTPDLRYSLYGTAAEMLIEYEDYEEAKKYMPTLRAIAKILPGAASHLKELEGRFFQIEESTA